MFFGKKKAIDVTTPALTRYTLTRSRESEAATVNKELAHLRRAFRLRYNTSRLLLGESRMFAAPELPTWWRWGFPNKKRSTLT